MRSLEEASLARIIAICAPAGFGKSVAVRQWLRRGGRVGSVLELSHFRGSVDSFRALFNAAAERIYEEQNAVLVIEDMQNLASDELTDLLFNLIRLIPFNFKVVLVSRSDLSQKFSEMWLKGMIARVPVEKFTFTADEVLAIHLFNNVSLTPQQAELIAQQTGGWAIGINAHMLSKNAEISTFFNQHVDNYLETSVWENLDEPTQNFLLSTAYLHEITPEMGNALAKTADSAKILNNLHKNGIFTAYVTVGVYQYFPIFRDFLRRRASLRGHSFVAGLNSAQGDWFLSQGEAYRALEFFTKSSDLAGIVACWERLKNQPLLIRELLSISDHPQMRAAAAQEPSIYQLLALLAYAKGDKDTACAHLNDFAVLQGETPYMRIFDPCLSISQLAARETAHNEFQPNWSISFNSPLFHRGIRDFSWDGWNDAVIFQLLHSTFTRDALMLSDLLKASLEYEKGRPDAAYRHITQALSHNSSCIEVRFCAVFMLYNIMGALDGERKTDTASLLSDMLQMINDTGSHQLLRGFNALTVRIEISKGNTFSATTWIKKQEGFTLMLCEIYNALTTCRAHIALGQYTFAIILLKKILKMAKDFDRPLDIIEANILLAQAPWEMKGFQKDALKYLENAVLTALPHEYTQIFVNDAAACGKMLYKLQKQVEQRTSKEKRHMGFIKILHALTRGGAVSESSAAQNVKFTPKQLEVMRHLVQGTKHREIAQILGIKPTALRSRLELIYSKLDVTSAADAVAKIRNSEILPTR